MFDKNYICSPKGLPFVAYYKELSKNAGEIFTKLHFHDDFEILYICDGCAEFNIDGNTYIADKDTLVLVNPFETHSAKLITSSLKFYCLDFDIAILSMEHTDALVKEQVKYENIAKLPDIKVLIQSSCNAYFETPCGWQNALRGNLLLVFSKLEHTLSQKFPQQNSLVKQTILYLDDNLSEPITSKTAAASLGYNQSYFCRSFRKNFGYSFGEYLNMLRIEKAKSILRKKSVTETTEKCGFCSVSAFSQTFKKYTGISPTQYKQKGEQYDL